MRGVDASYIYTGPGETPPVADVIGALETSAERKWQHSRLKGIIALYVVVNALVQYVFDAAAIETALEQLLSLQMVQRRVLQELRSWPLRMNQSRIIAAVSKYPAVTWRRKTLPCQARIQYTLGANNMPRAV